MGGGGRRERTSAKREQDVLENCKGRETIGARRGASKAKKGRFCSWNAQMQRFPRVTSAISSRCLEAAAAKWLQKTLIGRKGRARIKTMHGAPNWCSPGKDHPSLVLPSSFPTARLASFPRDPPSLAVHAVILKAQLRLLRSGVPGFPTARLKFHASDPPASRLPPRAREPSLRAPDRPSPRPPGASAAPLRRRRPPTWVLSPVHPSRACMLHLLKAVKTPHNFWAHLVFRRLLCAALRRSSRRPGLARSRSCDRERASVRERGGPPTPVASLFSSPAPRG